MEMMGIEKLLKGHEKLYYLEHHDTIPLKWGGVKEEDREKVYEKALKEGKTWQEVTGFQLSKDAVL